MYRFHFQKPVTTDHVRKVDRKIEPLLNLRGATQIEAERESVYEEGEREREREAKKGGKEAGVEREKGKANIFVQ